MQIPEEPCSAEFQFPAHLQGSLKEEQSN